MTKKGKAKKDNQVLNNVCQRVVCIGLCLQLCFQGIVYSWFRVINFNDNIPVTEGPYAGMRLKEKYYGSYASHIRDLNLIQERSQADDPVFIVSQFNWLYLYIDRPIASYSCWMASLEPDRLEAYFERNPEKKPKYIYIDHQYILGHVDQAAEYKTNIERSQMQADVLKEMFSCSQEDLETGILLTVHS